jgi:sulfur carrier protein
VRIKVNGEAREFGTDVSLEALLVELSVPGDRVAIELNHLVVRRSEWTKVKLREDDNVEIVHFVGGGSTVGRRQ